MTTRWDDLAVTEVGDGPGVLWLHGYTMRSAVWEPLWREMPGWRHVGLDLPWHGSSRPARPTEDLSSLADTVVAHAVAASVSHLVALSFGTVLAAEMAVRHPEALDSWVLAAPALAGMPHEPAVAQRYLDLARLYAERGPGLHMTQLWMSHPPAIFAGVNERPAVHARVQAIVDRHEWAELQDGSMRRLVSRTLAPRELAAVCAPIALIVGEWDLLTHRACARSIAEANPAAVVRVMPGCGHLPLLEEPELAAALVAEHLRSSVSR